MTIGVMFPIESYAGDRPTMTLHSELAVRAEAAGSRSSRRARRLPRHLHRRTERKTRRGSSLYMR
jgi:hypothetical protein